MSGVIFYIISAVVLVFALYTAFSRNVVGSALALIMLILASSGYYILLHSELMAVILISSMLSFISLVLILYPGLQTLKITDDLTLTKPHYISIAVTGFITALLSSLAGSTRWHAAEVDFMINNYVLIFSKYLPLIILTGVLFSVAIASLSHMNKAQEEI
jgi:NADH:ubiquinone oxidoreductase subunit 6 (subunit J)